MELKENYIIGLISVKKGQNLKKRIINSYENWKREHPLDWDWENIEGENNEKEISLCDIYIDSKKINFTYFHAFENYGIFKIKYHFKIPLKTLNFLFTSCKDILYIDFSNLIINDLTNMTHLFYGCESLTSINMGTLNTKKLLDMSYMFCECHSLNNLHLSDFNYK